MKLLETYVHSTSPITVIFGYIQKDVILFVDGQRDFEYYGNSHYSLPDWIERNEVKRIHRSIAPQ